MPSQGSVMSSPHCAADMPCGEVHQPKIVLVTGGAGFIGSNYLLRMVRRHPDISFVTLDKLTYAGNLANLDGIQSAPNHDFVRGDITDTALVRGLFTSYDFDTVVHFAAESHVDRSIQDPTEFIRTNVAGTATLLDACRRSWEQDTSQYRFHHVSTDEVFGSLGPEGRFTEQSPYAPRSPYAASKASADHLVRAYGVTYGLPYVLTNTSNNYGPYQFPEKLIPLVIANARAKDPIPVYGKGENVRDWLYVEDHCAALEQVLFRGENGRTYLIGGDQEVRNIDLIHTLLDIVDDKLGRTRQSSRDLIKYVVDRPGHDFRYALDSSRIQRELGWEPEHDLEDGLGRTVDWYLSHADWLDAVLSEDYRTYYEQQYGAENESE